MTTSRSRKPVKSARKIAEQPEAALGGTEQETVRPESVARGSGVALWRQIAEDLETDIAAGVLPPGTRLPTESKLAARYDVNRHTLRRALAELGRKGMVDATPRRGTFVTKPRIPYRIARQTRFSENIMRVGREPGGRTISISAGRAPAEMAEWLGVAQLAEVIEIRHVRVANDVPICVSTTWFPGDRFKRIGPVYERLRSFTKALARLGVTDYERARTRVTSRLATTEERELLELGRGETVLVVESLDVDMEGEPISAATACFAADRVELIIER